MKKKDAPVIYWIRDDLRIHDNIALLEATKSEKEILLVRNNNSLSAFSNLCPHMNLPLEMGQITEDNEFLCPFHDSKFCLKTGAVKKWVLSSAEWMPDEAKELTKAIKEIPLDLLPVMDKDDYIWLGLK